MTRCYVLEVHVGQMSVSPPKTAVDWEKLAALGKVNLAVVVATADGSGMIPLKVVKSS